MANDELVTVMKEIRDSLKRIEAKLEQGIFDPNAPTNSYGEGLVDGIQNAIVRGQRGISTYGS